MLGTDSFNTLPGHATLARLMAEAKAPGLPDWRRVRGALGAVADADMGGRLQRVSRRPFGLAGRPGCHRDR